VDNHFFESLQIPSRQVINGCFCCNYNDLAAAILSLIETNQTEVIFAESVGSCTDIVATVLKPLLFSYPGAQVTVSVFADARLLEMMLSNKKHAFAETVCYIYLKQLEEAGIIVINKIDLIGSEVLSGIKQYMQQHYPLKCCCTRIHWILVVYRIGCLPLIPTVPPAIFLRLLLIMMFMPQVRQAWDGWTRNWKYTVLLVTQGSTRLTWSMLFIAGLTRGDMRLVILNV
jgi:hypothetical protein